MSNDSNPKTGTTGKWMLLFPVLLCVTTVQAISGIRIPPYLAVVLSVSPCFCLRSAVVFAAGFVLFCRRGADCIAQPSPAQFISGSRCVTSLLNDLGERAFTILPARRLDSKLSDWQDCAQSIDFSAFLFLLALKRVTNPQRGSNKLRKTTYRASSSCEMRYHGCPPYVWPPSVWSF